MKKVTVTDFRGRREVFRKVVHARQEGSFTLRTENKETTYAPGWWARIEVEDEDG